MEQAIEKKFIQTCENITCGPKPIKLQFCTLMACMKVSVQTDNRQTLCTCRTKKIMPGFRIIVTQFHGGAYVKGNNLSAYRKDGRKSGKGIRT